MRSCLPVNPTWSRCLCQKMSPTSFIERDSFDLAREAKIYSCLLAQPNTFPLRASPNAYFCLLNSPLCILHSTILLPLALHRPSPVNPPHAGIRQRLRNLLKVPGKLPQGRRLAPQLLFNRLEPQRHQGRRILAIPRHRVARFSVETIQQEDP